jgi:hypothetical protein
LPSRGLQIQWLSVEVKMDEESNSTPLMTGKKLGPTFEIVVKKIPKFVGPGLSGVESKSGKKLGPTSEIGVKKIPKFVDRGWGGVEPNSSYLLPCCCIYSRGPNFTVLVPKSACNADDAACQTRRVILTAWPQRRASMSDDWVVRSCARGK